MGETVQTKREYVRLILKRNIGYVEFFVLLLRAVRPRFP